MNPRSDATTTADASGVPTIQPSPWRLLLLCGIQLLMLLDFSIVNVALSRVETELNFSRTGVQWVISAYALTYGGLLLLGGRLSDQLGRRRMLLPGLALFGFASLLGGLAWTPAVLVVMRALQGVGAAFIAPAVLSLITTGSQPGAERNKALGWFSAASASGFAIGVLLGGALTQLGGWRWVFFVNVPLVAIALVATLWLIPTDRPSSGQNRYDIPGALLSTVGVSAVIYGLSAIGDYPGVALAAIAGGIVTVAGFIWVESRSADPLVPLRVFRVRSVSIANLGALLVPGVMGAVALTLALFLQRVQNRDALETGLIFLTLGIAVIVAAPVAAGMVTKVGAKTVCATGSLIVALGIFVISRISVDSSYVSILLPGLLLTGIGFSSFFASSTIAATSGVPDEQQGLVGGILNTSVQFGTALCVVLLTVISDRGGTTVSVAVQADRFDTALVISAIIAIGTTALILLALPGTRRAPTP